MYTPAATRFLASLARHNDREWFEPRRAVYEAELKQPTLALIEAVNKPLSAFAPDHVRPPAKAMLRFYRDTRFSAEKIPYKTHMAAWWGQRRFEKTSGGGFYFQFAKNGLEVAAGIFMPTKQQLLQVREGLLLGHTAYAEQLAALARPRHGVAFAPVETRALTRVPRGFSPEHPAAVLLRQTSWGVFTHLPVEQAYSPAFASTLASHFERCAPFVALINSFCSA